MPHPRNLQITEFTYSLPDERIAKYPLTNRDESKVLVYRDEQMVEDTYHNIANHLPPGALLIFNDTRVVEARLVFKKPTGGEIEIFCLEPADDYRDITTAMLQKQSVTWKCLVGGASKWKHGMKLEKVMTDDGQNVTLSAEIVDRTHDSFLIKLSWQPAELTFAEILHVAGKIPLPPYLHRMAEEADKERYQTIYARHEGSVAAPTAGLHFTDHIFSELKQKQVEIDYVTLHVGAGTFKPVKAETIGEHNMHAEYIDVLLTTIEHLYAHVDGNVIAVGTTSVRTLESLYWMGVKVVANSNITMEELEVQQWEPYNQNEVNVSTRSALLHLQNWMKKNNLERLLSKTQIIIAPGYQLKIVKAVITNFHQPQSTLLLLIAAFTGPAWKHIYNYALEHDFRFLSYGDGCLLWAQGDVQQ